MHVSLMQWLELVREGLSIKLVLNLKLKLHTVVHGELKEMSTYATKDLSVAWEAFG